MTGSSLFGNTHPKTTSKTLYVKYMVSMHCKKNVRNELTKMEIDHAFTMHGAINFPDRITQFEQFELKQNLLKHGLILLDENESMLVDKIIQIIVDVIHNSSELPKVSYSEIISDNLNTISDSSVRLFSEVTGMSVLQFIITQKIERAKELLLYNDLSLTEIADILNYKNEFYLIAQFKKHTGLPPEYFKSLKLERMKLRKKASLANSF